jgi:hypothetical protein
MHTPSDTGSMRRESMDSRESNIIPLHATRALWSFTPPPQDEVTGRRLYRAADPLRYPVAFFTFPERRHRVHTCMCLEPPGVAALTLWRFGCIHFFVLLLAWLTLFPVDLALPHM